MNGWFYVRLKDLGVNLDFVFLELYDFEYICNFLSLKFFMCKKIRLLVLIIVC